MTADLTDRSAIVLTIGPITAPEEPEFADVTLLPPPLYRVYCPACLTFLAYTVATPAPTVFCGDWCARHPVPVLSPSCGRGMSFLRLYSRGLGRLF